MRGNFFIPLRIIIWIVLLIFFLVGLWAGLFEALGGDDWAEQRQRLVKEQIIGQGIKDERVILAMLKVPRHEFVPPEYRAKAYTDNPLPIGHGQTISQPYIVALMSEVVALKGDEKVLEVGTGSGYQAAILAELAMEVYSVEIDSSLAHQARKALDELHYHNIWIRVGDGYLGWKEKAPFDAIVVTAAPDHVPEPLLEQLKVGGRMVIPIKKNDYQQLMLITRNREGIEEEVIAEVKFVPMKGVAEGKRQ